MAMLISKFHRLIQSKLLWTAFLIIIVLVFVVWGMQMPTQEDRAAVSAGTLDGEPIQYEQYQQARFNTYLGLVLMTGRALNITPELEEELHTMAWQRLASLKEAERLGISSSNDEVIKSIHGFDFLKSNGRFNPQAYDQFAQQFLAPMRATKRDFEEHVRQEIILQKLRVVIDRLMLVSPKEIERTYQTLTDSFEIQYVKLTPDLVAADVEVSNEDAEAFFNKDPEQFRLAEKVKVKAAVFPAADYAKDVEVSDAEIQEYYDFNIDEFAIEDENKDDATNLFSTAATTYRPIEEVKDLITGRIKVKQSLILAEAKANEFVQQLSDRHSEGRGAFDAAAAALGVEIIVTEPFSARQTPKELDAGTEATRAAFSLSDDDDYYYSDAVVGSNTVYVLALAERQPERVPEFAEVKADVMKLAREMEQYNALTEKAQKILEQSRDAVAAGQTFDDALASLKVKSIKPPAFALNAADLGEDFPQELVRHILVCNAGEFTDLIPTETGEVLLAYVKSRTPSAEPAGEAMRSQIVGTLRRQGSQVTFRDFQAYLLKRGNFVDNLRRAPAPEDSETDEEESETGA